MNVKFDPKFTLGNAINLATIFFTLLAGFFGVYAGMQSNLEKATTAIADSKIAFNARAVTVDNNFAIVNQNMSKLKEDVADLKTAGAVSQANQVTISKQIDAVQNQIANLQRYMMEKKVPASYPRDM